MQAFMQELHTLSTKPYLIIYFEHNYILRPSHALIQPAATFNLATVRAHVLESLQSDVAKVLQQHQGQSAKKHLQLIRLDRICAVCVGTTTNDNFVNAMKLLDQESTTNIVH